MKCSSCGAPVQAPVPGSAATPCPFCRAPVEAPAPDPRQQLAGLLADRNGNGIPDVLEGPAGIAAGLYRVPAPPVRLDAIPRAPRSPSANARSLVFAYRGSQGVMLLMGLIFLGVGTLMSTLLCWGLPGDLALALAGAPAQASVVSTETGNVKINGAYPELLKFRYRVGGASYDGESSTLDSSLRSTPKGAAVRIEYLPFAPEIARVVGTTRSTRGYVTIFLLILPVGGGAFAFGAWRSNRREIRAFVHGTAVVGQITYQGPDMTVKVNGRHPFKLEWEFQVGGTRYTGSFSTMSRGELGEVANATELAVLYDPSKPAVNTLWVA